MTDPLWVVTARTLLNTHEAPGSADNQTILDWGQAIARKFPEMEGYTRQYLHDSTPWCGYFMGYIFAVNGIRPPYDPSDDTHSFMWANAWQTWGFGVEVPQVGDVLCLNRHVTMYVGEEDGYYCCLGGNQSDSVNITKYPTSAIVSIRRPPPPTSLPNAGNIEPPGAWNSGKGSWYSQLPPKWIDTGDRPNSNALGVPDYEQGIALYDRSTLGKYFDVMAPDGRVFPGERQTDIGPHPNTGRKIDISAALAERMGYTPGNFPTDATFKWRPAQASPIPTPSPAMPEPKAPEVTNEQLLQVLSGIAQVLVAVNKRLDDQAKTPQGKSTFSGLLSLLVSFFPQLGVWGTVAMIVLNAFGMLGSAPVAGADNAVAMSGFSTFLGMIAHGVLSMFAPPTAEPKT